MGDLIAFFAGLAVIVYGFNRLDDVERRRRNDAAFDRHADEALAVANDRPLLPCSKCGGAVNAENAPYHALRRDGSSLCRVAQSMSDEVTCEAIARLPLYDPEAQR